MRILIISTASAIFHIVAPAQYVAHLSHKFFTKSTEDCFKLYGIESHKHDKHTECLF